MNRYILFLIVGVLTLGGFVFMHETNAQVDDHTAREEAEGKAIWERLQTKEITCVDLSDDEFGALGEYYMGQMVGDSHEAMNEMMTRVHGEEGEEQIHIVMGKRFSGCDTSAVFSTGGGGWMPMMQMMWGGWSSPLGFNSTNNMMNFGYGFGSFGLIFMIFFLVLIIAGIVALIRWLASQSRGFRGDEKTPLDVLKGRYAKGEIDKKEFEEKKKDLS